MYSEVLFIVLYRYEGFKKTSTKKSAHMDHRIAKSADLQGRNKTTMIYANDLIYVSGLDMECELEGHCAQV